MNLFQRAKTALQIAFGYDAILNTRSRKIRGLEPIRSEEIEIQGYDRERLISTLLNFKRNDPVVKAISRLRKTDVVGSGILPQPATGNEDLDKQISDLWHKWSEYPEITRQMDFCELQQEVIDSTLTFGDIGVVFTKGGYLQVIEGDRISSSTYVSSEASNNKNGVIVGKKGQPVFYEIADRINGALTNFTQVPAKSFCLFYKRMRPNQYRGVPELAPCVNSLQDIKEYESIEMISAKVSASLSAVIKRNDSVQFELANRLEENLQDEVGRLERFEAGKFHYLEPNEDIQTISSSGRPNVDGIDFCMYHLRKVGAAVGIPVEMIMSTIGESSFSASQGLILQYQAAIEENQRRLVYFLNKIYKWKLGLWISEGKINIPADVDVTRVRWQKPAFRWVNKAAQVRADSTYVSMGAQSLDDIASQFGSTASSVLEQKAKNIVTAKELAEKYDISDWRELFNPSGSVSQSANYLDLLDMDNRETKNDS